MKREVIKPQQVAPATSEALCELEQMIGERRAFSRIADSCSAADADTLRRIRNEKLFAVKGVSWEEFCPRYLDISKAEANRIIRRFEEFGQSYFDVARIVRISPESYRAIAPAVKDKTIEWNGERISLVPENSQRVNAAVQALRQEAAIPKASKAAPPDRPAADRIAEIEAQSTAMVKELMEICRASRDGQERRRIQSLAQHLKMCMWDVELAAV